VAQRHRADHAIVGTVSEDDRALMERLAALEAEVKADAQVAQARKQAAVDKLRAQRAAQEAERERLAPRAKPAKPDVAPQAETNDEPRRGRAGDLGGALELATRAHGMKEELTKPAKTGDKSWAKSALASTMLGPIGWLYAGSMREAIPASAAWLAFAAIASKLIPMVLLFPVLLVALPLSGIAGLVYAIQYNRTGRRQRLFGDKTKDKKQLDKPR
jgi:hypothetical protein